MRLAPLLFLTIAGLTLAGCVGPLDTDMYARPGTWAITGAPREDTALEANDKSDLLVGKSDDNSQGVAAAAAVDSAIGGAAGTATGLQKVPPAISFSSGTGS